MPACGLHRDPPKVSAACSYYDSDRRVKLGEVRVAWQKRAQVFARLGAAAAFLRADCAVFMVVSVPLALLRARDAADDARQKGVVEHPRLAAGVPRQQPDRHTAEVGFGCSQRAVVRRLAETRVGTADASRLARGGSFDALHERLEIHLRGFRMLLHHLLKRHAPPPRPSPVVYNLVTR